jgi:hypothetical protein
LFDVYLNYVQIILIFRIMMTNIILQLHNHFSKAKAELKAELKANLEAEALPEALIFCWKRKRRKRKRKQKRLGWKRKR